MSLESYGNLCHCGNFSSDTSYEWVYNCCHPNLLSPHEARASIYLSIEITDSSKKCVIDYLQKMVTARAGCDPRSTYSFNLQPSCALWSAIALCEKVAVESQLTVYDSTIFWQQDSSKVEEPQRGWKFKAAVTCNHVDGDYIHLLQSQAFQAVMGGDLTASYRWQWLSLRNFRLKFTTSGKVPIILEESRERTTNYNRRTGTSQHVNRMDLGTLRFWLIMPKNVPNTRCRSLYSEVLPDYLSHIWW